MSTKGYGSYRGRSAGKRFARILGISLIILVVLALIAYIYLQQFLIISDDGVHLEFPFASSAPPEPAPTPTAAEPPVIETPEPTPTPAPTPTPEPVGYHPVPLPTEALYDGSAPALIEQAGGDSALFDMKADDGSLRYISALDNAVNGGLNPNDVSRNAAILALNQTDGLYTVARVSCFKDHGLIQYSYDLAIHTNSGYRWTDPDGVRWSSPTNSQVRDYLTAVCVELAQLGFDEILLDNAGYPNQGNLHYIKKGDAYDADRFAEIIDGFYAQVALALADYDVTLSVVATDEALAGTDTLTGQTPENLARFDRIWVRKDAEGLSLAAPQF